MGAPSSCFPGLHRGEKLSRTTDEPPRGRILSRDGKVLAEGPARRAHVGPGSAGRLDRRPGGAGRHRAGAEAAYQRGFPRDWPVGPSGLERAFEGDLAGRPGGQLIAGRRLLARGTAAPGKPVRTTIDTRLQQAAVTALAGRFGGIAALDARTGQIRALAGVAFSAPQPPGSTFKIVTTTAALEARKVKLSDQFPVRDARRHRRCRRSRTRTASRAGAASRPASPTRATRSSRRSGSRSAPSASSRQPSATASTPPRASPASCPARCRRRARSGPRSRSAPPRSASSRCWRPRSRWRRSPRPSPAGGVRMSPTLRRGQRPAGPVRVTTRRVARTLERLMVDVVAFGTGTSAALPGVKVAGKTGTAELEDTRGPSADKAQRPQQHRRLVRGLRPGRRAAAGVGVMLVRAGAGRRNSGAGGAGGARRGALDSPA